MFWGFRETTDLVVWRDWLWRFEVLQGTSAEVDGETEHVKAVSESEIGKTISERLKCEDAKGHRLRVLSVGTCRCSDEGYGFMG